MVKSINGIIDDLTAKLKEMKTKHMEHIKAYVDREFGGNVLPKSWMLRLHHHFSVELLLIINVLEAFE